MKRMERKIGFTLLELLIVLAIVGLFCAICYNGFRVAKTKKEYEPARQVALLYPDSDLIVQIEKYWKEYSEDSVFVDKQSPARDALEKVKTYLKWLEKKDVFMAKQEREFVEQLLDNPDIDQRKRLQMLFEVYLKSTKAQVEEEKQGK